MPRYFLELSYRGNRFAGFQVQDNATTIQSEVAAVLYTFYREEVKLTGSSRTDAGVHARQNYFHFDLDKPVEEKHLYNLNALLPADIAISRILPVAATAHCRFDALWREYEYGIYAYKDPFLADRAYYYPYTLDREAMKEAAAYVLGTKDFSSFSKKNTQVKTHICEVKESEWMERGGLLVYRVKSNRFLRGMVRGLVGTMLQVGRGYLTPEGFGKVIDAKENGEADFSVPGRGLFLMQVVFANSVLG